MDTYTQVNAKLALQAQTLARHSSELEGTYRRVVSLCTGVGEEEVEAVLGGLVIAVDGGGDRDGGGWVGEGQHGDEDGSGNGGDGVGMAEGDVGRLRAFLQRVDGG